MSWNLPDLPSTGTVATIANWATKVRDSLRYLKGLDGATTLSDALILPDGAGYYLHIPILTTTQRDALTPTAGMLIYNSTTTQFNKYENGAWRADLGYGSAHANLVGLTNDEHTQYQKENLLTTAGDMAYATAASTWARLEIATAGKVLRVNTGATAPEWGVGLTAMAIRKTADETVNNSTTLQNDDHLLFAMGANEVWEFRFILRMTTTAVADFKIAWALPTGGSISWRAIQINAANAGVFTWGGGGPNQITDIAYSASIVILEGIVVNSTTAGNLQLQWAQNAAEATNTQVLTNSCIIATKLN